MTKCKLDHSSQEVEKKLESQRSFLPAMIYKKSIDFLSEVHSQSLMNELFHLLKKYDLASSEEQERRNKQIIQLTTSQSSDLK